MICGVCGNPPRTYVYARPHTHARALTALLGKTPQIPQTLNCYAANNSGSAIRVINMSEAIDGAAATAESATAAGKRVVGIPFQKGTSGNPTGRPKVAAEVRELAREHGPAAIVRLVELMSSKDEMVAIAACRAILDRGYGKPEQSLNLPNGGALLNLNLNVQPGQPLTPEMAYKMMCAKLIPADPAHPAFHRSIETQPVSTVEKAEDAS